MFFGGTTPAASTLSGDSAARNQLVSQITDDAARSSAITAILAIASDPTKNSAAVQMNARNAAGDVAQAAYDFQASVNAHAKAMNDLAAQKAALQQRIVAAQKALGGGAA